MKFLTAIGCAMSLACAATFAAWASPPAPAPPAAPAPTFARDIAPIVYEHCAQCHRPAGAGPFSLLTVEAVRQRARQVAEAVAARYMPPWMPEPGHGEFVGERRLSDEQIALVRRWVEAGAPAGDLAALPPPPTFAGGWQLGEPDLVVTVPTAYRMTAEGADHFRTFLIPVPVAATRYVRAVEFRPGNARAVHHAVVRVARPGVVTTAAEIRGDDHASGMLSSDDAIASPDGHLLGWAPGYSPNVAPPDMPWSLEPGAALAIEVHLQATGKPEDVQPSVGLFFTDRRPTRQPFGLQLGSYAIDIPPGATHYAIEDRYTLPVDVEVLAIYPHAHYLGRDIRAWAILPDGAEQSLIWIRDWNFSWQNAYRYAAPVALPRGSTIAMRYVYDNSSANPRNPHSPPRQVRYGGQSTDEMGNLWLQVVPRASSDLPILTSDYQVKSTERQVAGYQHLLECRPDDPGIRRGLADALNQLGVTLHQRGRVPEAASAYRRALAAWEAHAPARTNLGTVLRSQGRPAEAAREYRAALAIDPAYGDAHYSLGLLLQQARQTAEALVHFRRAATASPSDADPLNALAWFLVTDPQATAAMRDEGLSAAERAVQLTGERDASALDTLAAAHAANGRFDRAIALAERAAQAASAAGQPGLAEEIQARLALYRVGKPYWR